MTQIHPDQPGSMMILFIIVLDDDNKGYGEDCDHDDIVHLIIVMRIYILNFKGILYQRGHIIVHAWIDISQRSAKNVSK